MVLVILAVVLAFLVQLAVWQGAALGITFLINHFAELSISYYLVGGIVGAFWLVIFAIKLLLIIGGYRTSKKIDEDFGKRFR
jgi:sorbitol-specific phosphotransferase system component IIC